MKTFIAGNLEVMREDLDYPDFPLVSTLSEIQDWDLGDYGKEGWRLPNREEIKYLYKLVNCASYNRQEWNSQKWSIGNFGDDYYWAKSDSDVSFVIFDFLGGSLENWNIFQNWNKGKIRLVRNI